MHAYCMARGISPAFRWVPAELNCADAPSRIGADKSSSLATEAIESLRFPSVRLELEESPSWPLGDHGAEAYPYDRPFESDPSWTWRRKGAG